VAPVHTASRVEHADHRDLRHALDGSDLEELTEVLNRRFGVRGPTPYDRTAIVRALIARHFLPRLKAEKIPTLTALCVALENNPALREACGFGYFGRIPSRSTFSREHTELSGPRYRHLLRRCILQVLICLKGHLPDLGEQIAIDSTVVEMYANPNRRTNSDPRATWTKVHSARHKDGIWKYGYKLHAAVDANYDIPLSLLTTTAKTSDMTMLIPLMDRVWADGFDPKVVIADRGYDWIVNSTWLYDHGVDPVIHKRRTKSGVHRRKWTKLVFNVDGVPLCKCGEERPFLRTDPRTGHHVYGPVEGCGREGKFPGMSDCEDEVRVDPSRDRRLFGGDIRRGSAEWRLMYNKRWASERPFSRWKEDGCAEDHRFRGHDKIELEVLLEMLVDLVNILLKVEAEERCDTEAVSQLPIAA
jgi:IS5 family transposase